MKTSNDVIPAKGMSQAVRAGDLIYLAGQVAVDDDGTVPEGGIGPQTRLCFAKIERQLAVFGATLDDLVEVTAFIPHPFDLMGYVEVRTEVFSKEHPPATTTVVAQLSDPAWHVEVKAVACLGGWE